MEDGYFCDDCHELAMQGGFHYDLALNNEADLLKAQEVDVGDSVNFNLEGEEILGVRSLFPPKSTDFRWKINSR